MKSKLLLFIALTTLAAFIGACKKASTFKDKVYENQNMARSTSAVGLPTALWDLITPGGSEDSTEFISLRIYLAEKTKGILGGHNIQLSYGESGGDLDLKDFTQNKNGSFYIAMEPVLEEKDSVKDSPKEVSPKETSKESGVISMKVFFLSGSKHRKIGDQLFGSGCNAYYDITSYFTKSMSGEGFLVNTAQQRHISALAGTYFFVINQGGHLFLSELNVKDSRFKNLQCVNAPKTESDD